MMLEQEVIRLGLDICIALENQEIHSGIRETAVSFCEGRYVLEEKPAMVCAGDFSCMAPEVYWGERYDGRVDVYALGLLLYARLNEGLLPFAEAQMDEKALRSAHLRRLEGEEIPLPKHGSTQLQSVVMKACAYEPNDRYADLQQMAQALREV